METEKFELMLDEAQANAALEKGMLYADTFVNKNYLINLDRYPLVELDSAEKSDEYIRLYQIERIVYDVDENANDKLISVYSASGEMFSSSSDVQNNLAYSYANGFIFIIDPLTLNQFAMDVEDKVDLNAYGASSKDFDDILNIMLINLEKMFGLKDKDTLKRNLAVVINKVDIPTLEEKIGETAAQQYLAENAKTCKSYMDARDAVCRNFLEEYGAGNFVRTAEAKFKTVRYFTCSALGHNHEGQPYEGKNVVDPVMWLLQQADSSIKAE